MADDKLHGTTAAIRLCADLRTVIGRLSACKKLLKERHAALNDTVQRSGFEHGDVLWRDLQLAIQPLELSERRLLRLQSDLHSWISEEPVLIVRTLPEVNQLKLMGNLTGRLRISKHATEEQRTRLNAEILKDAVLRDLLGRPSPPQAIRRRSM